MSARQCPPCTGQCNQGRACPVSPRYRGWFADTPLADAAIAVALVIACGVLAMVLPMGPF